jgi:DDE superfamily endonuclease
MEVIRLELLAKGYAADHIFNMDEAHLFYKALPTRTYEFIADSEMDKRQVGRGVKSLRARDRLTLVLCCNATGSQKIDPLLIGTAKKPLCFRDGQPPVPYIHQTNAWMDRNIYLHWWSHVFLPAVRKFTNRPVALLMDQCSGHDLNEADPEVQVTVFFVSAKHNVNISTHGPRNYCRSENELSTTTSG